MGWMTADEGGTLKGDEINESVNVDDYVDEVESEVEERMKWMTVDEEDSVMEDWVDKLDKMVDVDDSGKIEFEMGEWK